MHTSVTCSTTTSNVSSPACQTLHPTGRDSRASSVATSTKPHCLLTSLPTSNTRLWYRISRSGASWAMTLWWWSRRRSRCATACASAPSPVLCCSTYRGVFLPIRTGYCAGGARLSPCVDGRNGGGVCLARRDSRPVLSRANAPGTRRVFWRGCRIHPGLRYSITDVHRDTPDGGHRPGVSPGPTAGATRKMA